MSETYTRELSQIEYNNVFELGTSFKGDASIKTAAAKINEKITEAVRAGVKTTKNEEGQESQSMPEKISVAFTRFELDGFWKGLVDKIREADTDVRQILVIKAISKALGMSKRFAKFEETEIALNLVEEELDASVEEELDD